MHFEDSVVAGTHLDTTPAQDELDGASRATGAPRDAAERAEQDIVAVTRDMFRKIIAVAAENAQKDEDDTGCAMHVELDPSVLAALPMSDARQMQILAASMPKIFEFVASIKFPHRLLRLQQFGSHKR